MPEISPKTRLDQALVDRGLVRSRSQARDAIKRGVVLVGQKSCTKPAFAVGPETEITLREAPSPFVSRGGLKLAHALDMFSLDVAGKTAIDLGASTGGFSDVLLQNGAQRVFCVDVGRDQLDERLRQDPRVVVLEGVNGRDLSEAHIPEKVDLVTCDVSFISLCKVLPASLALTRKTADLIALIKPQFEVGPAHVGKGGIVRDVEARKKVVDDIKDWLDHHAGWHAAQICQSPIKGPDGNVEFLLHGVKT